MSAVWAKNEIAAAKRRCDLVIVKNDSTLAPRRTDFMALDMVYISGVESPHYALATGTLTNKRRPLTGANIEVGGVDHATNDTLAIAGVEDIDGPFTFTTSGSLPGNLTVGTSYWLILFSAGNFRIATSLANAIAGTFVDLTSAGSGTHTLNFIAGTQRGIDGHFTYEASQAETNHDAAETSVIVDGTDYLRSSGYGAYTTVNMTSEAASVWDAVIENGHTAADLLRGIARQNLGTRIKSGTTETTRDLANTKDSHHGTVTSTGRVATIDDLT